MPPAVAMAARLPGLCAISAITHVACCCPAGEPLHSSLTRASTPPCSVTMVDTWVQTARSGALSSRRMTVAASSCARGSPDPSIAQSGCTPPHATTAVALSRLPERCHKRRETPTCVTAVPLVRSSMSGWMPFERAMSACSGSLLETIERSASAAAACASRLPPVLPSEKPPESHMMSVGTPPALAMVAWLELLPWHMRATALRRRTAPVGVCSICALEPSLATMSLQIVSRFSMCFEDMELSAPVA